MKTIIEMFWSALAEAVRSLAAPRPSCSPAPIREGWPALPPTRTEA